MAPLAQAHPFPFPGALVLAGAEAAQATRCPAVGNRLMSRPISDKIVVADNVLTPVWCTEARSSRETASSALTSSSMRAIRASTS